MMKYLRNGMNVTDAEFKIQYDRLADVFPDRFKNKIKAEAILATTRDLSIEWFTTLVDRIVCSPRGDFDIKEAAISERRAKSSVRFADDVAKSMDNVRSQMTDEGLSRVLKKYGSSSLVDAIENSRKGKFQ